jgi:hypothetical protein
LQFTEHVRVPLVSTHKWAPLKYHTMAKKIPYGISDYARIIKENYYYVDKTRFIETLEVAPPFLFLIRPRRFGKSLWLNLLKAYYDIKLADQFDILFEQTYIGQNPTEERNSYLFLNLNFSSVNPDIEKVEASFEAHCSKCFLTFNDRYRLLLGEEYRRKYPEQKLVEEKIEYITNYCGANNLPIYLVIDEYDNFTNTILSQHGNTKYSDITHGNGFLRLFFNKLKAGTTDIGASIKKIFITGVSPVTLDDVTSGFNIAKNISNDPRFNAIVGFTEEEVILMLNHYKVAGMIMEPIEDLLMTMREWYDNYCFSEERINIRMYNSDMVLYFIDSYIGGGHIPKALVDENIKIDYGKLRHLIILDKKINGNFSTLKLIAEEGEIHTSILPSFPAEKLITKESFVSLLYYFGILTIDRVEQGETVLKVPNLAIRTVLFSYLVEGFSEAEIFNIDIFSLGSMAKKMAYYGDWKPFFNYFAEQIVNQTSVRDFISGEKTIQAFHLIYLNLVSHFTIHSEAEMGKGFSDLWLTPNFIVHPEMEHCYLVEFKYVTRELESQIKNPESALTKRIQKEATEQLKRYATDIRVINGKGNTTLHLICVIYCGWEMVGCEEVI